MPYAVPPAERENELDTARVALAEAAAGDGGVLAICGPAGAGKTTLVDAIAAEAGRRGFLVLRARGAELETSLAFGVAQRLLARAAREHGVLGSAPEVARRLLEAATDGGEDPPDPFRALNGLFWVCQALAEQAPLLLAVDDTQWADEASLRFLAFIRERLDGARIAVLAARRPPEGPDPLLDDPRTRRLEPRPLSAAAAGAVVRRLAPAATDAEVAAAHRDTGGNPFYLVAVARELAAGRGLGAPESVVRSVLARVHALGEDAAAVARSAAVLGRDAELRHVAAHTGLGLDAVALAADALVRAHVLMDDRPLEFVHAILREAVLAELTPGLEAIAHRRAADVLRAAGAPPLRVAVQLLRTEPTGDPAVVDLLLAGADAAGGPGAQETSAALLERALAEPPSPEQRPVVLSRLGTAERHLFDPRARERVVEALGMTEDPEAKLGLLLELAAVDESFGRLPEAIGTIEEVRDQLDAAGADPLLRAVIAANAVVGRVLAVMPMAPGQVDDLAARLALVPEDGTDRRVVAAILAVGRWFTGTADAATVVGLAAGAIGRPLSPELVGRPAALGALPTLTYAGRPEHVVEAVDIAEVVRVSGSPWAAGAFGTWRAQALHALGRLAEAEAEATAAAEHLRPIPVGAAASFGVLGLILLDRHGPRAAAAALAGQDELPPALQSALGHQTRSRVALAAGDWRAARAWAEAQRDLVTPSGMVEPGMLAWRRDLALALHRGGEPGAEALALEHHEQAARFGAGWMTADALVVLAEVGDPAERGERLELAVEHAARGGRPLVEASALAALGAHLRRTGPPSAAREPLQRALDTFDRCGAGGLRGPVHDELSATGLRPVLPRDLTRHRLTASELRAARLAADGLTNREIAQTLFVTPKTVETHLRAVYRKLDIGGRPQLVDALAVHPAAA